jgi:hypothetical protein
MENIHFQTRYSRAGTARAEDVPPFFLQSGICLSGWLLLDNFSSLSSYAAE